MPLTDDVARDLALFAGLVWDDDREVLAPLVDAEIVWAGEEVLDAIAAPVVEALWADGLRDDIENALRAYGKARPEAFADLEHGPAASRLALAYVRQGALDVAGEAMLPGRCLCCVEDALAVLPRERQEEIVHEAAVELALPRTGDAEMTLRSLALLAERSLPRLSAAFLDLDFDRVARDVALARC